MFAVYPIVPPLQRRRRPLGRFAWLMLASVAAQMAARAAAPSTVAPQSLPAAMTLIVPAQAGGSADRIGGITAAALSRILETPVRMKNLPGANGITGTIAIARAPKDGGTIGLALSTPMAGGKLLSRAADYNPLETFDWFAILGSYGNAMIVRQDHPAKSLAEWLEHARAAPRQLRYGTGGIASAAHLAGEYLHVEQHANIVHVAFANIPQAYAALSSGDIDVLFDGIPSARIAAASPRQFRVIAVTSAKRDPQFPDAPAFGETWRGQSFEMWAGIVTPNHLQQDARSPIAAAIGAMLADKAFIAEMQQAGIVWLGLAGNDASQFLRDDIVRKARQIGDLAIQPTEAPPHALP
ncbi:MAG: tripartite tricarboxylate transporter substrate binding protein [Betaproteobacteria bacterium]